MNLSQGPYEIIFNGVSLGTVDEVEITIVSQSDELDEWEPDESAWDRSPLETDPPRNSRWKIGFILMLVVFIVIMFAIASIPSH